MRKRDVWCALGGVLDVLDVGQRHLAPSVHCQSPQPIRKRILLARDVNEDQLPLGLSGLALHFINRGVQRDAPGRILPCAEIDDEL